MPENQSTLLAKQRIIVALGAHPFAEALHIVEVLRDHVGGFMVGSRLLSSEGPGRALYFARQRMQGRAPTPTSPPASPPGILFYDRRLVEIPSNVVAEMADAARAGGDWINICAVGGRASIRAAVQHRGAMRVIGETIPSTMSDEECAQLFGTPVTATVLRLAELLIEERVDGIVCTAAEAIALRHRPNGSGLTIIATAIRPAGTRWDEHLRTATPAQAIRAGADYLLIGRPITNPRTTGMATDADRVAAAQQIARDIEATLTESGLPQQQEEVNDECDDRTPSATAAGLGCA